jgi:glycosyltransferase involved in cell wall biosynthesis
MIRPKVSVLVTAYNQAQTISRTLDFILNQDCNFHFEIIIGDDCSTDNTREICEKYSIDFPSIVKTVFHKQNYGVAGNFALIAQQAQGDYISICAADDFWHNSQKLQIQVDYFENDAECGLIYTDYDRLNTYNGKISKSYLITSGKKIYEGYNLIKAIFEGYFPALTLTIMFRKLLFDRYIPVDDYIQRKFTLEDWPTWLILSKYTKIVFLPISTATYCYGHESISNLQSYEKLNNRFRKEKEMYQYVCEMFPDDLNFNAETYDRYVNRVLLNLAIKKNDFTSARRYCAELQKKGDRNIKTIILSSFIGFYVYSFMKRIKKYLREEILIN